MRLAKGVFSSDSSESSRPLPVMSVGCLVILVGAELSMCLAVFHPFGNGGLGVEVGEIFSVLGLLVIIIIIFRGGREFFRSNSSIAFHLVELVSSRWANREPRNCRRLVIVVHRRVSRTNRRRVVWFIFRKNFSDGGPSKRTLASQMICSLANITSNRSGAITSQVAGFFTVKTDDCMTGVGEMRSWVTKAARFRLTNITEHFPIQGHEINHFGRLQLHNNLLKVE